MAHIKVYIRVRPLNASEKAAEIKNIVEIPCSTEILINFPIENYTNRFLYDGVFGTNCSQYEIFPAIFAGINQEVLKGFNNTVFACGQTISGKSYTMFGDEYDFRQLEKMSSQIEDRSSIGAIPRIIHDLFLKLHRLKSEFSIRISYLRIFNEELNDLLSSNPATTLKIYEDSNGKVRVSGLSEIVVTSPKAAYIQLLNGQERLKVQNITNGRSKSHTILTISVYIKEKPRYGDDEELLKFSKLSLVELAANENTAAAKTAGRKISHSLLSFNRVIQALIDKSNHIPYRDSKLTRILQDSLGGNSKTSIVATIAPGSNYFEETISTLEFVQRAKNICNKPVINERLNKTMMLNEISEQIHRLRCDIQANRTKTGRFLTDELYSDYQHQLNTSRTNLKLRKTEVHVLSDEYSNIEGLFDGVHSDLQKHNNKIQHLKENITELKSIHTKTVQKSLEFEHLTKKHSETEDELKKQGIELQTAIEKSCHNIEKVQDSIERHKKVDEQLQRACDKFSREMREQFVQLCESSETNAKNLKQLLLKCAFIHEEQRKQAIYALERFKSNTENLKNNGLNVAEINGAILEKTVVLANLHSSFKQNSNQLLSECIASKTHFDESQLTFDGFLEILQQQDELRTQTLSTIKSMISHQSQIVYTFCANLRESAKKFCNDLLASLEKSHSTVDEANSSNVKISSRMQSVFDEMTSLLNQANANNSVLLNEVQPSLTSLQTKIVKTSHSHISSVSAQLGKLNELNSCGRNFDTKMLDTCKMTVMETSSALEADQKTKIEMMPGNSNVIAGNPNTVEAYDNAIGHFNEFSKKFHEIPLQLSNNTLIEQVSTQTQAVSTCMKDQSMHSIGNTSDLKVLQNQFDEKTLASINYCTERLHQFQENEMRSYLSNGETPIKRDYKINRVLAATSPHERIKQKFYERFQNTFDSDLDLSIQDE